MSFLIINNQRACKIIKENFDLMEQIMILAKYMLTNQLGKAQLPNINLNPDTLIKLVGVAKFSYETDFFYKGSHGDKTYVNPELKIQESNLFEKDNKGSIYTEYNKQSLLPLIFIAKTVAEWQDENTPNGKSINELGKCKNFIKDSTNQTSLNLAIVEFQLIRNAFTHRGNTLSFEESGSSKLNYDLLNDPFRGELPITKLKDGDDLLTIKYDTYKKLFQKIINEFK